MKKYIVGHEIQATKLFPQLSYDLSQWQVTLTNNSTLISA